MVWFTNWLINKLLTSQIYYLWSNKLHEFKYSVTVWLLPTHHFRHFPWEGRSEDCCVKIDPHSQSCSPPSGSGDLCRPKATREQRACVSFYPALFFSLSDTYRTVCKVLSPVQSAQRRLLQLHLPGPLAFAAKQQCRPLTWMELDNKPWTLHSTSHVIAAMLLPNLWGCIYSVGSGWTFHLWKQEAAANWRIVMKHELWWKNKTSQQCHCTCYTTWKCQVNGKENSPSALLQLSVSGVCLYHNPTMMQAHIPGG